jgi:hypothetical protein
MNTHTQRKGSIPIDSVPELKWHQRAAFWIVAVISITNLNGVAKLLWNVDQAFSLLLLTAAIVAIMPPVRSLWRALGPAGWRFMLFLALLLTVGSAVSLLAGRSDLPEYLRMTATCALVIMPCAQYAYVTTRNGRLSGLLKKLAAISIVHVVAVLTWGWWGPDAYRTATWGIEFDFNRYSGLFWNPNDAALVLVVVTALFLAISPLCKRSWLPLVVSAAAAVGVVLTFSRGGMLSLLIVVAYTLWRAGFKRRIGLIAGLATLGVATAIVFGGEQPEFIGDQEWDRVLDITRLLHAEHTANTGDNERSELLMIGFGEWLKSPVLGNGLGSQRILPGESVGVHNTFVMAFGEAGAAGGIAFLMFLWSYMRRSLFVKDPIIRDFLVAVGIASIAMCAQSHNYLDTRFFNVALGVALGILSGSRTVSADFAMAPAFRTSIRQTHTNAVA